MNTLGLWRDSTAQTMQPMTIPEDQPVDIIVLLDDSRLDQKTVSPADLRAMSAGQANIQAKISKEVLDGASLSAGWLLYHPPQLASPPRSHTANFRKSGRCRRWHPPSWPPASS
ncbi:MAG: hypothetical protein ACLU9S_02530 [Oscillospiraceae bacterium]